MTGTRPYGIDRRGRRLWIQISSSDWEVIEEQARRRYVSASGLISQIAAEWCDAQQNAAARPRTYYDAQRREHDEADVR